MRGTISKKGSNFTREGRFKDLLKAINNRKTKFKSRDKKYKFKSF